jgi:hypothetical protein
MLQQSIKVSLIAVSVEQLMYLLPTRCCLLPILPIRLGVWYLYEIALWLHAGN